MISHYFFLGYLQKLSHSELAISSASSGRHTESYKYIQSDKVNIMDASSGDSNESKSGRRKGNYVIIRWWHQNGYDENDSRGT